MKRLFSILFVILILTGTAFSQDEGDFYDDGFVYEQNGKGDQFLRINLGLFLPMNFDDQLNPGGNLEIGYYRFLNKSIALGGELEASYNISIGNKILVMIPITFGILYQPYINKFEFPLMASIGIGYQSWQNMDYFPSFVMKLSGGTYYRINESCSAGLNAEYLFTFQSDDNAIYPGNFFNISIGARYHF